MADCFFDNLSGCGGVAVLQGYLQISWSNALVHRGAIVVDCVVNVVEKLQHFR
jgi:hypothetical protein